MDTVRRIIFQIGADFLASCHKLGIEMAEKVHK